jgi:hypothetical protein
MAHPPEHTTIRTCPVCGKELTLGFIWEPGDEGVGVFAGWIPGITIEDEACANHMTWDQRQAVEDSALADAPVEPNPNYERAL